MKINELNHHHGAFRLKNFLYFNRFCSFFLNLVLSILTRKTKSYIFVATTGRSGSNSLNKIFDQIQGVASFHEPYPVMLNHDGPLNERKEYFATLFKRKKTIYIKKECLGKNIYFESNHMFIKNFSDLIIGEFSDKVKVIYLIREPILVARSFLSINSIPGDKGTGKDFLIAPNSEENLISLENVVLPEDKVEYQFCLCLWYWFEIQARAIYFQQKFPTVPFISITTEELNNKESLQELFLKLGIEINSQILDSAVGTKCNLKAGEKKKKDNSVISIEREVQLYELLKKQLVENNNAKLIVDYELLQR